MNTQEQYIRPFERKLNIFFLLLIILSFSIHIFIFFNYTKDAAEISNDKTEKTIVHEKLLRLKTDNTVKTDKFLPLILLILFATGIGINVFIVVFLFIDRRKIKEFLFPFSGAGKNIPFDFKDFYFFLIYVFTLIQIYRLCMYYMKDTLHLANEYINNVNVVAGTLGIQLMIALFIVYYSRLKYKYDPAFIENTKKYFFKNIFNTIILFISLYPWIIMFSFLGLYLSQQFGVNVQDPETTEIIAKNPWSFSSMYLIIHAVIGAPFYEEYIFRGFLYSTIKKRWGIMASILLTSLIFAASHMNFLQFFYIFGLGIALAVIYESTSNLWFPVILHSVNNIIAVIVTFIYRSN
ncbi:MAG: CPBP family intramembrane metalloprotease [Candidatus Aureabacteria bacterium]|nr:CPBP family intramembrane metalloprotease [Candidatus Auribacterota bacterium]